jgi:hypothetical protein
MAEDLKLRVRRGRFATAADPAPSVDGTVSASLTVSDAVGNSFSASTTVEIDPHAGETVRVSGASGTLGSASDSAVKFVVTDNLDDFTTGTLTLTDVSGTATVTTTAVPFTGTGTYTENLASWGDGTVSAALTVSDAVGNSFTASTTVAIDPDYNETASVSGPPGTLGSGRQARA